MAEYADLSKHTPSTESVRRMFLSGAQHPDAPGGFDRWLATHDRQVAAKAVERYKRELAGFQPGHGEYRNIAPVPSTPEQPEGEHR